MRIVWALIFVLGFSTQAVELITRLHPRAAVSESADGPSGLPKVSSDGRFILFTSGANNLLGDSSGNLGIHLYRYDRQSRTVQRVTETNGVPASRDTLRGSMSASGNLIAFESASTNLAALERELQGDVFVKDMTSGKILFVTQHREFDNFADGKRPIMSRDGQFVFYEAVSSGITGLNDTNNVEDIFVRDLTKTTPALVSARSGVGATPGTHASTLVTVSTNANFVLFYSLSRNLNSNHMFTTITQRVWLRDLTLRTNYLVSRGITDGQQESASAASMDENGSVVAFVGHARLGDAAAPNNHSNAFVRVMTTDQLFALNLPASVKTNLRSAATVVSPDGARVALATHRRASGTNDARLFIFETASQSTVEVDLEPFGKPEAGAVQPHFTAAGKMLLGGVARNHSTTLGALEIQSFASTALDSTADGTVVALATAEPLVAGDLNGEPDVYVWTASGVELISQAHPRWKRPLPDLSLHHLAKEQRNSETLAFMSFSAALVENDTNGFSDIFTWSKTSGVLENHTSTGNGHSTEPALSQDGKWLAYVSSASNLVANDTNHMEDVFLKSLESGSTIRVTEPVREQRSILLNGVRYPVISSNGNYVAFYSTRQDFRATNVSANSGVFLFDRVNGKIDFVAGGSGTSTLRRPIAIYDTNLFYFLGTNVHVYNIGTAASSLIGSASFDPAFASDGSKMVRQWIANSTTTIGTYDLKSGLSSGFLLTSEAGRLRADSIAIRDDYTVGFLTSQSLVASDTDRTNDVYAAHVDRAGNARLVTRQQPIPRGNGTIIPRAPFFRPQGEQLYFLGTTNSIWGLPHTDLYAADLVSGALTNLTAGNEETRASRTTLRPNPLGDGIVFLTTARDITSNPSDKGHLLFHKEIHDSDGDRLPDLFEMVAFGSLEVTPNEDTDLDGASNRDEMLAGTNPNSAASAFRLAFQRQGNELVVRVPVLGSGDPIVETSSLIDAPVWQPVGVDPVRNGSEFVYRLPLTFETEFFRVVLEP